MESEFHRIKRLPPYVFAEVNALKAKARAAGKDIIDFGMGNPDLPTPQHIVDKLCEVAQDPKAHRYSASQGIKGLRKAFVNYYQRRFNVPLDADKEVCVTIGSKEGLANLASAITGPGDIILTPNPAYPIHPFGFIIADGSVRFLPYEPGPEFMAALDRAVRLTVPKPKALILNYPSNPTACVADLDFYGQVVDFCRFHGIYILSDLAYAEIYFDDNPPPSVLQIPGAKDICIEFTSMSKTYSMAGWRVGFAAGNRKLISALVKIKSYLDYGVFTPVQAAAALALNGPQTCVEETRQIYKERRDVLVEGLAQAGWVIPSPKASMFAWAPIPEPFKHMGCMEFSKLLLTEADVAVAPGTGFGEQGEGFVRIALVENKHRIRQAVRSIRTFFDNADGALKNFDAKLHDSKRAANS
ncbi:MAG: LL-diaminopimelate aminotransferase [Alphaproteobacteria bacterium]|nr:LL-diaminopimelate aminotransferase [Alphaproteobacteria bacterium]PHX98229.1 MAG: aminotransferase [Rhodospirillaceae bacterium]